MTWACSYDSCRMFIFMHSYVLLFLCLNKCGILLGMKKIPGLGQGWRVVGIVLSFSGCLLVLRQKNIRTKGVHWKSNVHSSKLDVLLLFQFMHLRCDVYDCFCRKEQNKRVYSLLFCSSRMRCLQCKYFVWWTGGCVGVSLLMQAQTNEHHLHSYVLLFLCLFIYRFVLSLRWDPWS